MVNQEYIDAALPYSILAPLNYIWNLWKQKLFFIFLTSLIISSVTDRDKKLFFSIDSVGLLFTFSTL